MNGILTLPYCVRMKKKSHPHFLMHVDSVKEEMDIQFPSSNVADSSLRFNYPFKKCFKS